MRRFNLLVAATAIALTVVSGCASRPDEISLSNYRYLALPSKDISREEALRLARNYQVSDLDYPLEDAAADERLNSSARRISELFTAGRRAIILIIPENHDYMTHVFERIQGMRSNGLIQAVVMTQISKDLEAQLKRLNL